MAEAIARRMIRDRGWDHVRVASAGTAAVTGSPASPQAVAVAAEHGLDLAPHRSRMLEAGLAEWADIVLAMSRAHAARVASLGAGDRVSLVTDFLEGPGAGEPVADPFGGDTEVYRDTWNQLEAAVAAVLDRIERFISP